MLFPLKVYLSVVADLVTSTLMTASGRMLNDPHSHVHTGSLGISQSH